METVHDTDVVFEAVAESGLRATIGKCMMDFDAQVPRRLQRDDAGVDRRERRASAARWDGAGQRTAARRVRAALRRVVLARAARGGRAACRPSTRARAHARVGVARRDRDRPADLRRADEHRVSREPVGLASPHLCAAHCVWVDDREQQLLGRSRRQGDALPELEPEARIRASRRSPEMRARGITVSLGADGAACNNRLDMFEEMRLAAVLQAMRDGPGILPARDVLWMATRAGARTLGLDAEIGSIEAGKRADVIVVDRDRPHLAPGPDPHLDARSTPASGSDVRTTVVDAAEVLVDDYNPVRVDRREVAAESRRAAKDPPARRGLKSCYC